jgi:hypothetical protein
MLEVVFMRGEFIPGRSGPLPRQKATIVGGAATSITTHGSSAGSNFIWPDCTERTETSVAGILLERGLYDTQERHKMV